MTDCLVVIPARLGSTRFPAKVLATLDGRPIVEWCRRAAAAAKVGPVVVATDHPKVVHAVEYFGGEAVLTPDCASGTDRVWAVARTRKSRFVINLQGDEPLIRSATIRAVARLLRDREDADIGTAVVPMSDRRRVEDPNVVKAAVGKDGRCLYFSRAPIPYRRASSACPTEKPLFYQHIGIYGFRFAALKRFVSLPPSRLERLECLEQLRALEAGMTIFAATVPDRTVAIDAPRDMARAARTLKEIQNA